MFKIPIDVILFHQLFKLVISITTSWEEKVENQALLESQCLSQISFVITPCTKESSGPLALKFMHKSAMASWITT